MSLKTLIEAAEKKVADIGDPGDDADKKQQKAVAEAELAALKAAESDKEVFTQDDLNARDKAASEKADTIKGRIEKMFGTDIESVENVLQQFENVLPKEDDNAGGGTTDDAAGKTDDPVLSRALKTIEDQNKKIETLTTTGTQFQRQYYKGLVEDKLAEQFGTLGLTDDFAPAANQYLENIVKYDDLVDKRMKGEELTEEEVKAKVEAVKTASPVWFQPVPNPDLPNIPVTPNGDPPRTLTDEERRQASEASGGRVF